MFNNFVYDRNYNPGAGLAADGPGVVFDHRGGRLVLGAFGTFGGGSLQLQFTNDADATWQNVGPQNGTATLLTAAGSTSFFVAPGRYRVNLTGSTAPALFYYVGDANAG